MIDDKAANVALDVFIETWVKKNKSLSDAFQIALEAYERAKWQPIETAPRDGTEFYAAKRGEYPMAVYYQEPSPNNPDHIWMCDAEKSAFHRNAFDVWRKIDAPKPPDTTEPPHA